MYTQTTCVVVKDAGIKKMGSDKEKYINSRTTARVLQLQNTAPGRGGQQAGCPPYSVLEYSVKITIDI